MTHSPDTPATPEGDAISTLEAVYRNMADIPELPEAYQPRNIANALAALRSLPPQDGEREPDWTEAARHMLEVWDSWLGGKAPAKRDDADRLLVAACFAAQQFEDLASSGMTADGAPSGLLRAFLLALIDPALPELDHLRACNRSPAALTAQPVAQEPVAWLAEVHNKYQTRGGYDERIDVDEWRQTVMLNEPQGPRYRNIRPLYAHPATPAPDAIGPWRMALENAARMAEQGILSMDGGQAAVEIRALAPDRLATPAPESARILHHRIDFLRGRVAELEAEAATPAPSPADQIIGLIEARFPDWKSYRDLVDCIDCTLHRLREPSATPAPVEAGLSPDLVAFLRGEAPLDGVWFGEAHPVERGAFWWRNRLRAQSAPVGGEVKG